MREESYCEVLSRREFGRQQFFFDCSVERELEVEISGGGCYRDFSWTQGGLEEVVVVSVIEEFLGLKQLVGLGNRLDLESEGKRGMGSYFLECCFQQLGVGRVVSEMGSEEEERAVVKMSFIQDM